MRFRVGYRWKCIGKDFFALRLENNFSQHTRFKQKKSFLLRYALVFQSHFSLILN